MKWMSLTLAVFFAAHVHAESANSISTSTPAEESTQKASIELVPVLGFGSVGWKGDKGDWSADTALSTGGLFEVGSGYVTFQTGLLYNSYGQKNSIDDIDFTVRLAYLSVPVLAKVNIMGDSSRTVYLKLGVEPSFLLSKDVGIGAVTVTGLTPNGVNSFDLPAVAGVGGAIRVAKNKAIIIEGDYITGLTKAIQNDGMSVRHEGFMITSGFSFGL